MAWDKQALLEARGIVFAVAGVLLLIAYLISRFR
jgi:hypothetical protein